MRLHRFYTHSPIGGETFDVSSKDLVHQWKTVFRYNVGSQIILFDGSGSDYLCMITSLRNMGASVAVIKKMKGGGKPKINLTLCVALIKKDNFELVTQKATEIGVTRIIPVLCERSEKKNLNMERLEKVAVEASEQSGRGDVPKIEEVIDLSGLLDSDLLPNCVIALDLNGKSLNDAIQNRAQDIAVLLGPEGGFSENELKMFVSHNIPTVSLGAQTLRAETAAIAISSLLLL